ncbi:CPBP family intramembrane metalloprotease [Oscillochloris sp. ZM17-4]|uniref:CPBP family intramembrane glutamic endopeptidase n=1 Tax=Oscillochloris sp. ZM17-4 TaxID=2866714 RepID=UPI001C730B14|nr:CPBP family intramembrane glutamic endopeptidase [Oscillochloris sp. ZM17-4]MBX0330939.1 CPBP family intramembrane metalloprotease [Oscillochloris sp. ZM17-4]
MSAMVRGGEAGMAGFFRRQPVVAAVGILAGDMLLHIGLQLGFQSALTPFWAEFAALVTLTAITMGLVAGLGWWRESGFNRPAAWRSLGLLWLPAAMIFALPFALGFRGDELGVAGALAAGYLLVGLREETLWRGVTLYALRRLGPMRAAMICGLLFGLSHLANLSFRASPAIVLAQVVGAATGGFGYAALRLRTNTIWPLIILHAFGDFSLHFGRLPVIPVEVARDVVLLCYGISLLWGWRGADREA